MFTIAAARHQTELALIYVQNASCIPGFSLHQVSTAPTSSSLIPAPLSLTSVNLPSFVINRSRNTILAKWLEERGVRVFNPAIVTDLCNDKRKTYEFLRKHGISFMETAYDIKTVADWEYPFVVKPACGHGGDLVNLVGSIKELAEHLQKIKEQYREHPGYVLQRCASDIGTDLRVYILGGKIVASVMRSAFDDSHLNSHTDKLRQCSFLQNANPAPKSYFTSPIPVYSHIDIRSNYSLGHPAALHTLTEEEETLVQRIIPLLPFDCIGIDFIYDKGHPVFNEIEDAVGARMLYANSDIDLVSLYMDYIMTQMIKR